MSLISHRDDFVNSLTECKTLHYYAIDHISNADVKNLTLESAHSRAFRAYENFVENAFLAFMTGEPTASGVSVERYVSPPSPQHARRMLQGKARFLDWADPSTVIDRGADFLHAEGPLPQAVTQAWNTINYMRKIRNHIAHNSVESAAQYSKVVSTLLLVDPPELPRPGELLQTRPRRGPYKGREILLGFFSELELFVSSATG